MVGFYLQDLKKYDNDTEAIKICSNVYGSHSVINLQEERINKLWKYINTTVQKLLINIFIHQGQSKWW